MTKHYFVIMIGVAFAIGVITVALLQNSGTETTLPIMAVPESQTSSDKLDFSSKLPLPGTSQREPTHIFGPQIPERMRGCWSGAAGFETVQLCVGDQRAENQIQFTPPCIRRMPGYHEQNTLISSDDHQMKIKEEGGWSQAVFGLPAGDFTFSGELDCSLQNESQLSCHEWHQHMVNGQGTPMMPDENLSFVLTRAGQTQR